MKNHNVVPVYFPSTVIVLDDDELFLNSVPKILENHIIYQLFTSPQKASDFLEKNSSKTFFDNENYSLNYEAAEGISIDVDIAALHQKIYDEDRTATVSVIIADYSMPEMNGIAFFKKIQHLGAKKILLTGIADEATAIAAFNNGIIDKFIRKSDANADELINKFVEEMQVKYFHDELQHILDVLRTVNNYPYFDDKFSALFFEKIKENNIVECYLLNEEGDFLFLDADGKEFIFIVKSQDDLNPYIDIADDSNAPEDIIRELKDGKKVPFFESKQEFSRVSGDKWKQYVFEAEKVRGEKCDYFFALISNHKPYKKDGFISHNDYVNSRWKLIHTL